LARKIYQYKPIKETINQGVGILLPMNKSAHGNNSQFNALLGQSATGSLGQNYKDGVRSGGSVFALSYSTEEQALSNLKNLLATNRGERYMQPRFGTRIREAIFEPNTTDLREFLNSTIQEALDLWLPYIDIVQLELKRNIDQHTLAIRLTVNISEREANKVIIIFLSEDAIEIVDDQSTGISDDELVLTQTDTFGSLGAVAGNFGGAY
jgi:phage baseplate assembly protein W|tara:strand:- start:1336 stop:1962 length:627 start_codon:yes stop_codon:yes gene_type:complete